IYLLVHPDLSGIVDDVRQVLRRSAGAGGDSDLDGRGLAALRVKINAHQRLMLRDERLSLAGRYLDLHAHGTSRVALAESREVIFPPLARDLPRQCHSPLLLPEAHSWHPPLQIIIYS